MTATILVNHQFLYDVSQEEFGSWEDMGEPVAGQPGYAAEGDDEPIDHAYVILTRHRGKLEIRSAAECELLLHHVLDNSIDKAAGRAEDAQGFKDYPACARWLRNLRRLREKIEECRPAFTSQAGDVTVRGEPGAPMGGAGGAPTSEEAEMATRKKAPARKSAGKAKEATHGNGHFRRVGRDQWVYALTGNPVPGARDIPLARGKVGMWAPETEPEALITNHQAAEMIAVKTESWRRMLSTGQAPEPCWRIAGSPIWTRGVIEQWNTLRPGRGRKWANG